MDEKYYLFFLHTLEHLGGKRKHNELSSNPSFLLSTLKGSEEPAGKEARRGNRHALLLETLQSSFEFVSLHSTKMTSNMKPRI